MLIPGLLSVTFRSLSPEAVIALAAQASLKAINWSADIHVKPGDWAQARAVGEATRDAGLAVAGYGSYYQAGVGGAGVGGGFADVCATAQALGAPAIRIWAGDAGSDGTNYVQRDRVIADTQRIADLAADAGLCVAYEYHANTLTDTAASALALHRAVNRPNVYLHWQPPVHLDFHGRLDSLKQVVHHLANVHVFHRGKNDTGENQRLALSEGESEWLAYLRTAAGAVGASEQAQPHYALMEFVAGDDPDQFRADAAALCSWIEQMD